MVSHSKIRLPLRFLRRKSSGVSFGSAAGVLQLESKPETIERGRGDCDTVQPIGRRDEATWAADTDRYVGERSPRPNWKRGTIAGLAVAALIGLAAACAGR